MRKALVTRPEEDVTALATALLALNITPVHCPLLEIHYLPLPAFSSAYQAVIFTSKHGVRSVASVSSLKQLPALCVGDATAETAKASGFQHVISASGDASDLLALVPQHIPQGTLLYISGKHTAHDITAMLSAQGYQVQHTITYEAKAIASLPPSIATQLEHQDIPLALFYSARTALAFESLLAEAKLLEVARTMQSFCLSDAIATSFKKTVWKQVHVAAKPTQESLLACVKEKGL